MVAPVVLMCGKLTMVEAISRLAKLQAESRACIPEDWHVPEELSPDYSELVLDLLGVPPDNWSEMHEKYGEEASRRPDCFCRDWLVNRWHEVVDQVISVEEFITHCLSL